MYYVFTVLQLTWMSMLVCVHACSSVFLFSPSLPPSLCVYIIPLPIFLYPSLSLSLVSSDNLIPHWSDDVMPCPHVITLPFSIRARGQRTCRLASIRPYNVRRRCVTAVDTAERYYGLKGTCVRVFRCTRV